MVSKKVKVVNPSGLHLRPAGVLSQTAMKFKSRTLIECGEKHIVAKSVLNVMAAGIKCGTEITVACDGPDENFGDSNWIAMTMKIRKIAVTSAIPNAESSSPIDSSRLLVAISTPYGNSQFCTKLLTSFSAVFL